MQKTIEIKLLPEEISDTDIIRHKAIRKARVKPADVTDVKISRRSIDARGSRPVYRLKVVVYIKEKHTPSESIAAGITHISKGAKKVIIVGAGPAGYFAALQLLQTGLQPVIFERGKDVQSRRRDLRAIQQEGIVHPHSNYCFGEGGAGTYSDGKLYTRSHKRGNIQSILQILTEHGASGDILVDAHPHIGSNKLPKVVASIRRTITQYGGVIHFNSHVTDIIIQNHKTKGVVVNENTEYFADAVILATGHSARDIYTLLQNKGLTLEPKPFALGVRIEHPQVLIDEIQYNQSPREEGLPAATYRLACQAGGRGVFSFCMCPGGLVVPAATAPGEIVVNGMSLSRRDSPYANAGTVVAIETEDLKPFAQHTIMAGLELQKSVEQTMFNAGDGSQRAPALRMTDFVHKKLSPNLPASSYIPGLFPAPLYDLLPKAIYSRLAEAIQHFSKIMKGYYTAEANVIGTESRTSAPIRIPRDAKTLMHVQAEGLFPCGEGAGYAGGIVSAALDGQNVAKAVGEYVGRK